MINITFNGQSCFSIEHNGVNLLIDPFLDNNPQAIMKADDAKADYILLTHGHGDHFEDTEKIAKRTNAQIIATYELAMVCTKLGLNTHMMHIGGAHYFDFGRVKLTMAQHGGGLGHDAEGYSGPPVGILITIDGKTIYHAGDTGLFLDMKLIGELDRIDLALLPIGDNFTMGPEDAAKAAEFLKAKKVVPHHYNTFPLIEQDPEAFKKLVKGSEVIIMKAGDTISL